VYVVFNILARRGFFLSQSCRWFACLATDINMNKEVVVVGETGLIIPVQDANVLAMAMLKMVQHPEFVRIRSMNSIK
jgi:hypothetical protein